jgi:hypothetical protein
MLKGIVHRALHPLEVERYDDVAKTMTSAPFWSRMRSAASIDLAAMASAAAGRNASVSNSPTSA